MGTLAEEAAALAARLSRTHRGSLTEAYRAAGAFSVSGARKVAAALPRPHRQVLDPIHQAWAAEPDLPGTALALALDAAACAEAISDRPEVDVVVTGPNSPGTPVQLTSEVVHRLIDDAQQRVTMVSFAAYQIDAVVNALDRAARRGVTVELILESADHLKGGGGAASYAGHTIYEWPPADRVPASAKLHAKAIIVDSRDVLLTSANMTNAAYSANIELGVLCRGGSPAKQVQQHFDGLIGSGILVAA